MIGGWGVLSVMAKVEEKNIGKNSITTYYADWEEGKLYSVKLPSYPTWAIIEFNAIALDAANLSNQTAITLSFGVITTTGTSSTATSAQTTITTTTTTSSTDTTLSTTPATSSTSISMIKATTQPSKLQDNFTMITITVIIVIVCIVAILIIRGRTSHSMIF